jgi:hypothetical protein
VGGDNRNFEEIDMLAEKFALCTDSQGRLIGLPPLAANVV